jgi:hypothetical protein
MTHLENIKTKIEKMEKHQHIEILKFLKKNPDVILNENKSGVYVNLSFLPKDTISELENYLNYIEDQETSLVTLENQKEDFKNKYYTAIE